MKVVSAGTRLVYATSWETGIFGAPSPKALTPMIRAPLDAKWGILVEKAEGRGGGFFNTTGILTLHVLLRNAYGDADHVRLNIDHEIIELGASPFASRITSVQPPNQPNQPTGAPPPSTGKKKPDGSDPDCGFVARQLGLCEGLDFTTVLIIGFVVIFAALLLAVFLAPAVPARVARSFAR